MEAVIFAHVRNPQKLGRFQQRDVEERKRRLPCTNEPGAKRGALSDEECALVGSTNTVRRRSNLVRHTSAMMARDKNWRELRTNAGQQRQRREQRGIEHVLFAF